MSKSELLKVYSEMLKLYLRLKSNDKISESEVLRIYREYLKLSMKMSFNIPSFIEDRDDYKSGNCYCYAIGFTTPRIIGEKYYESSNHTLRHDVGFISGIPYSNNRKCLIDSLESDLEKLGIDFYDCNPDSKNIHGGYKIALYRSFIDFHFLRENGDGSWSHKLGYGNKIERFDTLPLIVNRDYDFVKTLEIVKPVVRC